MSFEIVSQDTWEKALKKYSIKTDTTVKELEEYKPTRSTNQSAGYDFRIPFDLICEVDKEYSIPTGIKWNPKGSYLNISTQPYSSLLSVHKYYPWYKVLVLVPRSSLGFQYGFTLLNTVGVIDSDYYNNTANEGHIIVKFKVDRELDLYKGQKFCQGIILPFLLDGDDTGVQVIRSGGMGSTDN